MILAQVALPEEFSLVEKLLANADRITVEVVVLVAVILLLRWASRWASDQSKESFEQLKLMGSVIQSSQDSIKSVIAFKETVDKRFEDQELLIETVAEDVFNRLTKPGGLLFTVSEQNHEVLLAIKEFAKSQINSPLGLLGIRPDGTVVSMNEHAVSLLGIPPERVVGSNVSKWTLEGDILSEDGVTHIPVSEFPVQVALREKRVATRIVGMWNPKRSQRVWLLVKGEPAFDSTGELGRVVVIIQDVGMLVNARVEPTS